VLFRYSDIPWTIAELLFCGSTLLWNTFGEYHYSGKYYRGITQLQNNTKLFVALQLVQTYFSKFENEITIKNTIKKAE
jgi:hypothetical protein